MSKPDIQDRTLQAEALETGNAAIEEEKYLSFRLGEETYGVAVARIREIIQHQPITSVPQMPFHVRGVLNLRGKVIPVVDMRLKFALGDGSVTERTCIIVVQYDCPERGQILAGLIVDAVDEVRSIPSTEIEERPALGTSVDNECILGLTKIEDEVVTLLNIERILTEETLQV